MKPLTTVAASLLLAGTAQAATINLSGSDATGFLAVADINNEAIEPNTPGGKPFAYPYYFDAAQNLWVTIVAEKLSAASVYAQESSFTVKNKGLTDADFGNVKLGSVTYADGALSGVGTEVLAPGQFTLALAADDYSPKPKARNVNNEFNWTYSLTPGNLSGTGLTFVDGMLASMDFSADMKVELNFNGATNPPFRLSPGWSQAVALVFEGNRFAFDMDVTAGQSGILGTIDNVRLQFNRAGTLVEITPIPEPSTYALLALGALLLTARVRQWRGR
jgi:hypothetical protein